MAKTANKKVVEAAMKPPEYRAATKRLESIKAQKTKQSEASKAMDKIYNACEGINGVHKEAAKFFIKLQAFEDADAARICTDINGLLSAAGRPTSAADMVDQAQGKENSLRLVSNGTEGMEESDFGDEADALENAQSDTSGDGEPGETSDTGDDDDVGSDDAGADVADGTSDADATDDIDGGEPAPSDEGDNGGGEPEAGGSDEQQSDADAAADKGDDADAEVPLHERMKAATDRAADANSDLMGD